MKTMNKKVFGILGVSSYLANFNADFSGLARKKDDGQVYGSDGAMKYPFRRLWVEQGHPVLHFKRPIIVPATKTKKESYSVRSLKENYEYVHGVEDLQQESVKETIQNLFKSTDVRHFGSAFPEGGKNISITGAVQFRMGYNKFEDCEDEILKIIGPHRTAEKENEDKKGNSTIGTKIVTSEAHYFYPFDINPAVYKPYIDMGAIEYGYTEEDYAFFKESALVAVTAMNSASKAGCENEFALFLETPEDVILPIGAMNNGVEFHKKDGKGYIVLPDTLEIKELVEAGMISKVEIYYNPITTDVVADIPGATYYNIFTKKEITK